MPIDIVARLAPRQPGRVLEIAAGTGVVTRQLASVLPDDAAIVATDLNQAMLDHARVGRHRPARRMATGRCHEAAVRGRVVRRRRLPVRRHVLPRPGQGLCRGAARARAGRRVPVQRLGPDRGQRIHRHRHRFPGRRSSPMRRRASWPACRTATTTSPASSTT